MRKDPSSRRPVPAIMLAASCVAGAPASHATDSFNAVTDQLTIPGLLFGSVAYSDVVVTPGTVVKIAGGTPIGTEDTYAFSPAGYLLTVPSVAVGSTTYTNVTATIGGLESIGGVSGADSYDGTYVYIPSVSVAGKVYNFAVVTVVQVDGVDGGFPKSSIDSYSAATNQVFIPAIVYGGKVYTNVHATVGNVRSVNGSAAVGGANSSACYDPAYYATGTTMDLYYEDPTRGAASAFELQSVVVSPSTFNGVANAVGLQQTTISATHSSAETQYFDITSKFPVLLQLGFYSSTLNQTQTYTPGVQFSGALSYGQSLPTSGVAAVDGGTPSNYTTDDVFEGFEDVTVPAGTFRNACKWSLAANYGTGPTRTTGWFSQKGVLIQLGTLQLQAGSKFNGSAVAP